MKLIKGKTTVTKKWSGGLTTQLFISPEGSEYGKRNFDFRISTATVEVETSNFTPLEKVKRTLMVLDGEMRLEHAGRYSKVLKPFYKDVFDGGWDTVSEGKCVDFNLMTKGDVVGDLTGVFIQDKRVQLVMDKDKSHFLYVFKGEVEVEGVLAEANDLMVFESGTTIALKGVDFAQLVHVEIG